MKNFYYGGIFNLVFFIYIGVIMNSYFNDKEKRNFKWYNAFFIIGLAWIFVGISFFVIYHKESLIYIYFLGMGLVSLLVGFIGNIKARYSNK